MPYITKGRRVTIMLPLPTSMPVAYIGNVDPMWTQSQNPFLNLENPLHPFWWGGEVQAATTD